MSKELELSNKYFPGGVNSPVRAFKSVGCEPPFIRSAYGSRVIDVHDNDDEHHNFLLPALLP